ncbi:carbohydrate-binding module family 63 protein [Hortaea werneckii]|nr:carbohydrate-binding module family 63 protein [Hortaea werneckii]
MAFARIAMQSMLFAGIALAAITPAMHVDDTSLSRRMTSGDGTWYGKDCGEEDCWQDGACAFTDYTLPASIAGSTCVSEQIWNSSYNCGGCVSITYQGKKKTAMITNKTGGDAEHLDMSPDMFSQLADKGLGEIDIEWEFVPCPFTDPLWIKMHGGASQYWFAATVENARRRTAKMEVSADGGETWQETVRDTNNFFTLPGNGGTGTETALIRVTSHTGTQVEIQEVDMTSGKKTVAQDNYA